jgi:hypothetical protein
MNYCWHCGKWTEVIYSWAICEECLNDFHSGKMNNNGAVDACARWDIAGRPEDGDRGRALPKRHLHHLQKG